MQKYSQLRKKLKTHSFRWLVTGAAGFIGSNLVEELLKLNQSVIGVDNFSTGSTENFENIKTSISDKDWQRFTFINGDITDFDLCYAACKNIDFVLHQAALGSIPRSIEDPINTHASNVTGFLNMLTAAKDRSVKNFTYASSSSVYGSSVRLPKIEDETGEVLSPYALSKKTNEEYAKVFFNIYGFPSVGLRYFNVFGKYQSPTGAYAAVIPKWINAMLHDAIIEINGDGETSRDFCYIDNVIQANLLSSMGIQNQGPKIFNVAVGVQTNLNELFKMIRYILNEHNVPYNKEPIYKAERIGDVRHSLADITRIKHELGYETNKTLYSEMKETLKWYIKNK